MGLATTPGGDFQCSVGSAAHLWSKKPSSVDAADHKFRSNRAIPPPASLAQEPMPSLTCPNPDCRQATTPESSFCGSAGCGCPLITPEFPDMAPISNKTVILAFRNVAVNRFVSDADPNLLVLLFAATIALLRWDRSEFARRLMRENRITYRVPWVLVTSKGIIFVDESKKDFFIQRVKTRLTSFGPGSSGRRPRNIDYPLCPFWILDRSVNGELDEEFKRDPQAYSKARGAWWVQGYRCWDWVSSPISIVLPEEEDAEAILSLLQGLGLDGDAVRVPLQVVFTASVLGLSQQTPTNRSRRKAYILFDGHKNAPKLVHFVEKVVSTEHDTPGTEQYIAKHPPKPMSGGFRAYYYGFWIAVTAILLLGVLLIVRVPSWIAFPASLIGCLIVGRRLRSRELRARERATPSQ
jgi:hypothetical protein